MSWGRERSCSRFASTPGAASTINRSYRCLAEHKVTVLGARRRARVASDGALASMIGITGNAVQVGLLRGASWAARGLRVPARNALLADVVAAGSYGRAYGFERTMDNLGAIGGPQLALGLVAVFSVRTAILVSVVPGLLAAWPPPC